MNRILDHPEFDFEHQLPAGREWFTVIWLARHWGVSQKTIKRLIEDGSFAVGQLEHGGIDLAPAESKHALHRVHREALVKFLNDRSKIEKHEALRRERRRRLREVRL